MDPHSFIARAEAQRWLGIAEKLLMGHDLVGSKTFAIRARESDPRLEGAEQILAIADTLLAAEKRVVGNNGAQQPDFYAILQLVRFVQDTEHIGAQYRRLAFMLNPHQNRFPYSDQAFQLVNDAWAVLSNPMRKSMYDSELNFSPPQQMNTIGFNLEQHHHHHQQQQQHQHNFFSIPNHIGSGHEQELPESPQNFQIRAQQSHQQQQLQQHNFLSQSNPIRPVPVREQEQFFQPQVQQFLVKSPQHQQSRPSPQSPQPQPLMQPSPPPPPAASPQPSLSWSHAPPPSQPLQLQQPQPQPQPQSVTQKQQQPQPVPQKRPQPQPMSQKPQLQQAQPQPVPQKQQLQQPQPQPVSQKPQHPHAQPQPQPVPQKQQLQQPQPQSVPQKQQQQPQPQSVPQRQRLPQPQPQPQPQLQKQEIQQPQLQQQPVPQKQQHQQPQPQSVQQRQPQPQPQKQEIQQPQLQKQPVPQKQQLQQPHQQPQGKQQPHQQSREQNAAPVQNSWQVDQNIGAREEKREKETAAGSANVNESSTIWTACPFCFYMYEYGRVYAECTLRCDNCKRAFQAVPVPSPPIIEGKEAYFCCWGFFPIGVSMSHLEKNKGTGMQSRWAPFSPLNAVSSNMQDHSNGREAPKTDFNAEPDFNVEPDFNTKTDFSTKKNLGPRVYIDDFTDDLFTGIPEESTDESDVDWGSTRKTKKVKKVKRMKKNDLRYKKVQQALGVKSSGSKRGRKRKVQDGMSGTSVQEGVGTSTEAMGESSTKAVGANPRRQSGRVAKDLGKLDLNVEFNNNEGEEPAPGMTVGNRGGNGQGEEDNIEGIGFFEGLDEFLSSLPILSAVNDEKVKAA